MTRLAVFDCDGTLVDGQASVCDAMEMAFDETGLAVPDRNEIRRSVGLSLPYAVRGLVHGLEEEQVEQVVAAYKSAFFARRQEGQIYEPLYDGMASLLTSLQSAGWLLAVATGKSDRGLNACLTTHGIDHLFVSLQTADRHPSKPHPAMLQAALNEAGVAPADAVMIGDTSFDMIMASDAGVRAIGVEWGYHDADELRASGAADVARDASHLEELL